MPLPDGEPAADGGDGLSACGPALRPKTFRPAMVIGDPAMQTLDVQITRAARSTISVLILGETGVGKELVAEKIHQRSGRSGRFVAINCAALSENLLESELFGHERGAFTGADRTRDGLVEVADGGTLFLDEVGELSAAMQVKLLRVLEERKVLRVGGRAARSVDVRFVAATHRNIEAAAEQGCFRQDLFYRLNGLTLHVPPLRERRGDITALAEAFILSSARAHGRAIVPRLSEPALYALAGYAWPGNIRELRNVVERAVLLCDGEQLLCEHLPDKLLHAPVPRREPPRTPVPEPVDPRAELLRQMEDIERRRIVAALHACAGNQTQAAEQLGISRRTLVTRLAQFNLPRPRKPRAGS